MLRHIKTGLDVLSTVVIIVAGGALLWRLYGPTPQPPGARPRVETVTGLSLPPSSIRHVRGAGPVALVAFSDYECPFCARHVQQTVPTIKAKLLDPGDIREVHLNFPLAIHANAQKASEAVECAAKQERFWEMHEALFGSAKTLAVPDLTKHAEILGLRVSEFTQCLDSGETAELVKRDVAEGNRLAVKSTPSFFIGVVRADGNIDLRKRINGAVGFEEFEKAIREVRPARQGAAAAGSARFEMIITIAGR